MQGPIAFTLLEEHTRTDGLLIRAHVPTDLPYLKGHFEGAPVVAGVVQLSWIRQMLERWLGRPVAVGGMEAIKFHQLLLPGQSFELDLRSSKGRWAFTLLGAQGKIASGRLVELPTG